MKLSDLREYAEGPFWKTLSVDGLRQLVADIDEAIKRAQRDGELRAMATAYSELGIELSKIRESLSAEVDRLKAAASVQFVHRVERIANENTRALNEQNTILASHGRQLDELSARIKQEETSKPAGHVSGQLRDTAPIPDLRGLSVDRDD